MKDAWYKRYATVALGRCRHLNLEERGALITLTDMMYQFGGPLDHRDREIAGYFDCSPRKARQLVAALVEKGMIFRDQTGAISSKEFSLKDRYVASNARPPVPIDLAHAVFERDGIRCTYCFTTDAPAWHLDHIHPWSRGGRHTLENLCVACCFCNWSKGAKTPEEWRATQ